MNAKKGVERIAKIISGLGWAALVGCVLSGIGYGRLEGFTILSIVGVVTFALLQGVVWIIDGFVDATEGDRSVLWPLRRKPASGNVNTPHRDPAGRIRPDLVGVHGWLFFFVFLLMVMSPLKMIAETSKNLSAAVSAFPAIVDLPGWRAYEVGSWISIAAFCAIVIWAAWGLMRYRLPSSVRLVIAVIWGLPIAELIVDAFLARAYLGVGFFDGIDGTIFIQIFGALFWALVWTLYFKFSRRVKNTYYHGLADMPRRAETGSRIEPRV